jgi:C1A family cysteine protease
VSENQNRILNWKPSPPDSRDFKSTRHLTAPIELPTEFELNYKIPIYNQFSAGSCVGNGSCEAFRYEAKELTGNYDFEPSRLFVYWNARDIDGSTGEDAGTYIRSGFKAMNKTGLCREKLHPYDDSLSSVIKKPSPEAYSDGLKNVIVTYASVNQNENEIKGTLVSGAVVVFGFTVYNSFFGSWSNSTGIMPLPKKNEGIAGGHCVIVTGFSDSKKCFKCQNSWGADWGLGGSFWMPYSFLLDPNQADDFWAIQSIKLDGADPNPPKPSEIDWVVVSGILFKTAAELYAVKKPTILRLGTALGLDVDPKKKFGYNFNLVKEKLGL